jgi:phage major head subunit gpT-like protein
MSTYAGKEVVTLRKGLNAAFVKAFNNAENPADVMPFIMETTSTSDKEQYGWLGQSPSMSEWIDERKLKSLNEFEYEIPNKDYEATLPVDRNALKDDQLGNVKVRIDDLARKAKIHPRKLFIEALKEGETELCYDGQPFFSASHEEGDSGVQSNLLTGTGITLAQLETDIDASEEAMLSFKDDTGEPWNEGEVKIGVVCHTSLKNKFIRLNTLDLINNTTNSMKGRISQITYSARFDDKNDWYLGDISEGMKPIIKQKRQDPVFGALEGDSDNGFMRKKYYYGIDYRVGFGYGLWQKMVKTKNA